MNLLSDMAMAAAAVVLASFGAGAAAAPVDLSSGSAGFVSTPGGGGFSDLYTFTLASSTTVNVLLGSVVGGQQNLDFSAVTLSGPAGTFSAQAFAADPFESWAIRDAVLTPGAYTLLATGTNSAAAGTYAGTIALAGSSFAQPGTSGGPLDLSSGSTGLVGTPGAGAFSDVYSFSLASAAAVNVLLQSVVGGSQDVDIAALVLTGPSGVIGGSLWTEDPFEGWTLRSPVLAPGRYTLTASGNNSEAVGTYAASIALAPNGPTPPNPVPEPGTAALLLVGLGAARAAARRRRESAPF